MQPGQPPEWSMKIPINPPDGVMPPVAPITCQAALSKPDANGHSWIILNIGDGTVGVSLRIPWQTAAGFGAALSQFLSQLQAQAQAQAGPTLIVPPPGAQLPDLGVNRHNGHKP